MTPGFRNWPDLSVIYSQYTWLFDVLIVALVFSLLFKDLGAKAGLNKKLSTIIGASAAFITVVYIHGRGQNLAMLGPWIIFFVAILFTIVIWKLFNSMNMHKGLSIPLAFLIGFFITGLLLGATGAGGAFAAILYFLRDLAFIAIFVGLIIFLAGGIGAASFGAVGGIRSGTGAGAGMGQGFMNFLGKIGKSTGVGAAKAAGGIAALGKGAWKQKGKAARVLAGIATLGLSEAIKAGLGKIGKLVRRDRKKADDGAKATAESKTMGQGIENFLAELQGEVEKDWNIPPAKYKPLVDIRKNIDTLRKIVDRAAIKAPDDIKSGLSDILKGFLELKDSAEAIDASIKQAQADLVGIDKQIEKVDDIDKKTALAEKSASMKETIIAMQESEFKKYLTGPCDESISKIQSIDSDALDASHARMNTEKTEHAAKLRELNAALQKVWAAKGTNKDTIINHITYARAANKDIDLSAQAAQEAFLNYRDAALAPIEGLIGELDTDIKHWETQKAEVDKMLTKLSDIAALNTEVEAILGAKAAADKTKKEMWSIDEILTKIGEQKTLLGIHSANAEKLITEINKIIKKGGRIDIADEATWNAAVAQMIEDARNAVKGFGIEEAKIQEIIVSINKIRNDIELHKKAGIDPAKKKEIEQLEKNLIVFSKNEERLFEMIRNTENFLTAQISAIIKSKTRKQKTLGIEVLQRELANELNYLRDHLKLLSTEVIILKKQRWKKPKAKRIKIPGPGTYTPD